MSVKIQEARFKLGAEVENFTATAGGGGAIVTFTGLVRDVKAGLRHMEIEHYPAMTQQTIEALEQSAVDRWSLTASLIIHRHGVLKPGEPIMMVATAARHRVAAFEAAEFLMDCLKSRAPFWKKEVTLGGEEWVAATGNDEAALKRW